MQIRAESSIKAGAVLVNVDNPNDTVTVTGDKHVNITVDGNSNKMYVLKEQGNVETVNVTFTVQNAETFWGQNVYIVGDCEELGNWNPQKAVGPGTCVNYPIWQISAVIPAGKKVEFKAIKKDASGNVIWESGSNHSFTAGTDDCNYTINWN